MFIVPDYQTLFRKNKIKFYKTRYKKIGVKYSLDIFSLYL